MAKMDQLRQFVLAIVDAEPEIPQPITDKVIQSIKFLCEHNQKEAIHELFRHPVRQAKIRMKERINQSFDILEKEGNRK